MKRNGAVVPATAWVNLNTVSHETSQTQKPRMIQVHLYKMPRTSKSIATESRFVFARGWGEGGTDGR